MRATTSARPWARLLTLAVLAAAGCAPPSKADDPSKVGKVATGTPRGIVEDDWEGALSRARAEGKPLFVDVWAPWCHTCLSLRAYVLDDPGFVARFGRKFVFATIDTEKDRNAAFVAAHPVEAWPTLLVVDPRDGSTLLRWLGAATAEELAVLLDDAAAVYAGASAGASATLAQASRLLADGKRAEARKVLEAGLSFAGARKPALVDTLVSVLAKDDPAACVTAATEHLPSLPPGTSRANVAITALGCAREAKLDAAPFVTALRALAAGEGALLADDRSGVFEALVDHLEKTDPADAKKVAAAWAAFLEVEAKKAKGPAARAVFDAHRMLAYLALGEPARALPMLAASEADFPDDYNPPARLAKVHLEMGSLDLAKAAIGRALARAYGPRRLRLLALAADVAKARGDLPAEKAALDEAIALGQKTKPTGGYAKLLVQLEARRKKL